MKVVILGGGTAGFIAAAHFTRYLPDAELLHIFDPSIPTIGVGEGTTPRFPGWFEEVTGLGFSVLAERCGATMKKGSRYENWGRYGQPFTHRFQPIHLFAYHFDAGPLVDILGEHVRATRIAGRVEAMHTTEVRVDLRLADGSAITCDYVFDARGFPRATNADGKPMDDILRLDWIPTNRVMIRRLAPGAPSEFSRAVARPHGWIFQVPLRDWTSCGYIFNAQLSTDEAVEEDFTSFLHGEGVTTWEPRVKLDFPNFVRRRSFDGRVFRGGNAASFIEPLEATAIGTAILQSRAAASWMLEHVRDAELDVGEIDEFNDAMLTYICKDSLFVAWHYAGGSQWDTPFWRYAAKAIDRARASDVAREYVEEMQEYIEAARTLPGGAIASYEDQDAWDRDVYPLLRLFLPFGNFSELNFAQVGHGIGYYDSRHDVAAQPTSMNS
ncbi:MAG: tryptophan 7-halogenase [Gemmatimonadaceae bacterium]